VGYWSIFDMLFTQCGTTSTKKFNHKNVSLGVFLHFCFAFFLVEVVPHSVRCSRTWHKITTMWISIVIVIALVLTHVVTQRKLEFGH